MNNTLMASRYGNSAVEMQVCQRLAPNDRRKKYSEVCEQADQDGMEDIVGHLVDLVLDEGPVRKDIRKKKGRRNVKEKRRTDYKNNKRKKEKRHRTKMRPNSMDADEDDFKAVLERIRKYATFIRDADQVVDQYVPEWLEGIDTPDVLAYAEDLLILIYQLMTANNGYDMIVDVTSYIKKLCPNKSVIRTFVRFLWPENKLEPNSLDDVARSLKSVHYVFCAICSLVLCGFANYEWNGKSFDKLYTGMDKKKISPKTLVASCLDCWYWMSTVGVEFFRTGNFCVLWGGNSSLVAAAEKYYKWKDKIDSLLNGSTVIENGMIDALGDMMEIVKSTKTVTLDPRRTPYEKSQAHSLYIDASNIVDRIHAKLRGTRMKKAAFGISVYGLPGVGKSCLTPYLVKAVMTALGESTDPRFTARYNPVDRYQSIPDNLTLTLIVDDIDQTRPDYISFDPNRILIDLISSVPLDMIKAAVEDKGKNFFNHRLVVVSGNNEDLSASVYSTRPGAILRRYTHVKMKVRPEFSKPNGALRAPPDSSPDGEIDDYWLFDIRSAMEIDMGGGETSLQFEPVTVKFGNGEYRQCVDLDVFDFLEAIGRLAKEHDQREEQMLNRARNIPDFCPSCSRIKARCACETQEMASFPDVEKGREGCSALVPNVGENIVFSLGWKYFKDRFWSSWSRWNFTSMCFGSSYIFKSVLRMADHEVRDEMNSLVDYAACQPAVLVPERVWNASLVRKCVDAMISHTALRHTALQTKASLVKKSVYGGILSCLTSTYLTCKFPHRRCSYTICGSTVLGAMTSAVIASSVSVRTYRKRKMLLEEHLRNARLTHASLVDKMHNNKMQLLPVIGVAGVALLAAVQFTRSFMAADVTPNANVIDGDISRDSQLGWGGFTFRSMCTRVTSAGGTITRLSDQMTNKLKNAVARLDCVRDGVSVKSHGVFLETGHLLVPKHLFYPGCNLCVNPADSMEIKIVRGDKPGGTFSRIVNFEDAVSIDNMDMVLLRISTPDIASLVDMLPIHSAKGGHTCSGSLYGWDDEKSFVSYRALALQSIDVVSHSTWCGGSGWKYTTAEPVCKPGWCMSPLLSEGTDPTLLGFHIAGDSNTHKVGRSQTLTYDAYERARNKLRDDCVLICHSSDLLPQMGEDILVSDKVHPKAVEINALESEHSVQVLGSTRLRSCLTSGVVTSIISDDLARIADLPNKWSQPALEPNYTAFNMNLVAAAKPLAPIDPKILRQALDDYLEPMRCAVVEWRKKKDNCLRPLTDQEAISGISGLKYLERMNMTTSCGFPLYGPKNNILRGEIYVDENFGELCEQERIRMMNCWRKGQRANVIFTATLKDEAVKIGKTKVRVFMAGPVVFNWMMRKYFMGIIRFLHMHPCLCETAVGINCFSHEWGDIMAHVQSYNDKEGFGWDYVSWDKQLPNEILMAAWVALIRIADMAGTYTTDDLYVMRHMAYECVYPYVAWNGTLLKFYNVSPSGIPLTVDVNGLCNSLSVRTFYYEDLKREDLFRSHISCITYGDDIVGSVDEEMRDKFNGVEYQRFMRSKKRDITNPTKEGEIKPHFPWNKLDFLKRINVENEDLGFPVGQLTMDSIAKSLHMHMKPKTIIVNGCQVKRTMEEAIVDNIDGAMRELVAHGRDVYEFRRKQLREVVSTLSVIPGSLDVSYDEYVKRIVDANKPVHQETFIPNTLVEGVQEGIDCRLVILFLLCEEYKRLLLCSHYMFVQYDTLVYVRVFTNSKLTPVNDNLDGGTSNQNPPIVDSGMSQNSLAPDSASPVETSQTATFVDRVAGVHDERRAITDELTYDIIPSDDSLANFMARPVLIDTISWGGNPGIGSIDPWTSFLRQSAVANRIAHYNLLRGDLKLKFIINGTPFHYGRFMISYYPLPTLTDYSMDIFDTSALQIVRMNGSMKMHVTLDPSTSEGAEMTLPFLHPKEFVNIPTEEYSELGYLSYFPLTVLRHANKPVDLGSELRITVYAWMENLKLAIPTAETAPLLPQADEWASGAISRPASRLAKIAGAMKSIPSVRPYALATEVASGAVAKIAAAFGYCTPVVLPQHPYIPRSTESLALTNTDSTVNRFALDQKQEVSVDPNICGCLLNDELTINSIAMRESYLGTGTMQTSQITGAPILQALVDPCTAITQTVGTREWTQLTNVGFVALPFRYWKGTIIFRFEVVCSKFHRGRIRVVWDPNAIVVAGGTIRNQTNESYMAIYDISNTTSFEFAVPWGQAEMWRKHAVAPDTNFDAGVVIPPGGDIGNGIIGLSVETPLVAPDPVNGSDISINVYMRAGHDFEVAAPQNLTEGIEMVPNSEEAPMDSLIDNREGAPTLAPGGTTAVSDKVNRVFFGEVVTSLRSLLKRYTYHETVIQSTTNEFAGSFRALQYRREAFPYAPVQNAGMVVPPAAINSNLNWVAMTWLSYFTSAYVGWRGSIRRKILAPPVDGGCRCNYYVNLESHSGVNLDGPFPFVQSTDSLRSAGFKCRDIFEGTQCGGTIANANINNVIAFEVPYYVSRRFTPTRIKGNFTGGDRIDTPPGFRFTVLDRITGDVVRPFVNFVAAGDDFTPLFYLGPRPMRLKDLPAP